MRNFGQENLKEGAGRNAGMGCRNRLRKSNRQQNCSDNETRQEQGFRNRRRRCCNSESNKI